MARRRLCVVLLGAALAGVPLGVPAAADPATPRLKLLLPSPGYITIDLTTVTLRRSGHGRPPKLRLHARRAKALPRSVRVLWATRVIPRRRRVTYATLMVAINKAKPTATSAQDDDDDLGGGIPLERLVFFLNGGVEPDEFRVVNKAGHDAAVNALNVPRRLLDDLFKGVRQSFGDQPFEQPATRAADPTLDTGHYDDGHAFGWKPRGQQDAWNALTTSLAGRAAMDEVVDQLEANLGVDIDGDGDKGAPRCEQSSYLSQPKEITVPPTGRTDVARFDTPVPNAAYYAPHHGYTVGGGCNRDEMVAFIEILGGGTPVAWYDDQPALGEDGSHSGPYCPHDVPPSGPSNRCLVFRPELGYATKDARDSKTYSVFVSHQNRFADSGGYRDTITLRLAWRPK